MITKYKDSVQLAYDTLYDEIAAASNGKLVITNLESFFGNIQEIAALDEKFLRLPLDEPLFEIDANARRISVPSDFASNGLSVQGDHLAETVFFSIDRYFDYMDLSNCNIRINWKIGSVSGQSVNFIKSTDIQPGYIIFGWPVAKDLTGKSGTLSFAVEFYKEDQNGDISYSLNTLISNINIKEGLVLVEPEVVNVNDNIINLLQNSSFGSGDAAIATLTWQTGSGLVKLGADGKPEIETPAEVYLMSNVNELDQTLVSTPIKMYASAQAGDADNIVYSVPTGSSFTEEYILMSKANSDGSRIPINENLTYYVPDEDGTGYKKASKVDIETWNNPDYSSPNYSKFYLRCAVVEVGKAGEYYINAQGVKYSNPGAAEEDRNKIGQGPVTPSSVVKAPGPELPIEITVSTHNGELEEGYTIDTNLADSVAFLDTDNGATLTVSAKYDSPAYEDGYALAQYTWYKGDAVADASKWVRTGQEQEVTLVDEGKYKVGIKTFLNGEQTDGEAYSTEYIVSLLASRIKNNISFTGLEKKGSQYWISLAAASEGMRSKLSQQTFTLNYELEGATTYSDEVIFDLYYVSEEGSEAHATTLASSKEYNPAQSLTITSAGIENQEGDYFIRITNKYNGSAYSYDTETIYINVQ